MKSRGLYIKILASFILLLAVAGALVMALFRIAVINAAPHESLMKLRNANAYVLQELVKTRLKGMPAQRAARSGEVAGLVKTLGKLYKAKIWIDFPRRKSVVKSFEGPIPRLPEHAGWGKGGFAGHLKVRSPFLVRFPFAIDGETAVLYVAMEHPPKFIDEKTFFLGLAAIGLIIALLMVPVSRLITVPLKELSRTSRSIASGNLGERVWVAGRDELGELGTAFNEMADRVENMIRSTRELTAHISHELRSPLTRMTVALELLSDKKPRKGAAGKRLLASAMKEIVEMDRLIGQILRLSKLEMRGPVEEKTEVDLAGETAAVLKRYAAVMRTRRIRLQGPSGPAPGPVYGFADDLRTAVGNVVDNAVKYAPDGSGIEIRCFESGGRAVLSASNDAPNLEHAEAAKLFLPFYRGRGVQESGSGLGLAITEKIVEMHGGSTEAEISEGRVTVIISLPLGGPSS